MPDFSIPDEWHRVEVLVGGGVKDRLDQRVTIIDSRLWTRKLGRNEGLSVTPSMTLT